jgi:hypothetical protein
MSFYRATPQHSDLLTQRLFEWHRDAFFTGIGTHSMYWR